MRRFAGYALKVFDGAALASAAATASFLTLAAFSVGNARQMVLNLAVKTHASTQMEENFDPNATFRATAIAIALTGLAPLILRGAVSAAYNVHSAFYAKPTGTNDATALAAQQQALLDQTSAAPAPTAV